MIKCLKLLYLMFKLLQQRRKEEKEEKKRKEEYSFDDDIYYMYIKNRTIDLRKYDVFPGDCYITLNAKVLPTREPMFYLVPPELSPENLKIRHAQMLASLEAEDQVYGPVHKIRKFITYNMNCKINCIYSPKTSEKNLKVLIY